MPLLRACSGALATALASGNIPYQADLFTVILPGIATYLWTSFDSDLVVLGSTYLSSGQWLSRSRWNVTNTMEVPTLEVSLLTTQAAFSGGPGLLTQLHNGLFDGGTLALDRVFMPTRGDTATYGTIPLFFGDMGAVTIRGPKATIKVRGKNSRLNVNAPRNVYQPGCLHTFCDPGCTLSAASFTNTYNVLGGATRSVLTVVTGPTSAQLIGGTLTMTSGADVGLSRSIVGWDGFSTITLAYPLPSAPLVGDTATIFLACDKRLTTCTNVFNNKINFRGFPFIPPPSTTAPSQ